MSDCLIDILLMILIAFSRDFVASYWPNKGTPGAQIKSMYDRIAHPAAESVPAPTTPATDPAIKANGIKPGQVPSPTPA